MALLDSLKNMLYTLIIICVFNLVSWTTPENALEPLYKAKGDAVELKPHDSAPNINNIQWNHGSNIAAEWFGSETVCLLQFKGRCMLNVSTGALTITNLNENDTGIYSVEINSQLINTPTELLVISSVSKPSISKQCNTEMTNCNLTCEGDTAVAEPITYKWFKDGVEGPSHKVFDVTEENEGKDFSCMLLNPVSNQSSESFQNPIIKYKRNRLTSIIVPVVLILVGVILGLIIFFICKRKRGRAFNVNSGRTEEGAPAETVRFLNGTAVQLQPNNVTQTQDASNQGSGPAATPNGVNGCVVSLNEEISIEVTSPAVTQNSGNGTDEASVISQTSNQDPASTELPATSKATEITSGVDETFNQDQTAPDAPNTSKETENSALMTNGQETTNPEPTSGEKEEDDGGDVD
ncbi:junctional adhesion molecule A-like isoform X2 [Notolabrus celidotus]|uniref:junctional adhesion molecule A-like isoform X2 n=1 Tax=Notolabrus celidotus TaxID=1203425 RepID=UPI00148FDEB8|nr:junctional adhesion molecule A-like isoform X2 [Notolabrus celidotus]